MINSRVIRCVMAFFMLPSYGVANETVLMELERAFQDKDVPAATRILGGAIDVRNEMSGWPLIVVAANHGRIDIVGALISTGSDVNAVNRNGDTATILAAYNNHKDLIELLASRGANLDIRGNDGATALIWAANRGHAEVVKALIHHGADINIDVRRQEGSSHTVSFPGRVGTTALIVAAGQGHADIVNLLLDAGANINATDTDCKSALRASRDQGRQVVVSILEGRGASKNPDCLGDAETEYLFGGLAVFAAALLAWELFRTRSGVMWRIAGYGANIIVDVAVIELSTPAIYYQPLTDSLPTLMVLMMTFANIIALAASGNRSVAAKALALNELLDKLAIFALLASIAYVLSSSNDMAGVLVVFVLVLWLLIRMNILAFQAQLREPGGKTEVS